MSDMKRKVFISIGVIIFLLIGGFYVLGKAKSPGISENAFTKLLGDEVKITKIRISGTYQKDKFNIMDKEIITVTDKAEIAKIMEELGKESISEDNRRTPQNVDMDNKAYVPRKDKLLGVKIDVVFESDRYNNGIVIIQKSLSKNYFDMNLDATEKGQHAIRSFLCFDPKFFDYLEQAYYKE